MLETLAAALNQGKELEAQEALEALIEVADNNPRFLRRQLESVLNTMVMVAEAENLEDATRNYAVRARRQLRLCGRFVQLVRWPSPPKLGFSPAGAVWLARRGFVSLEGAGCTLYWTGICLGW